MLTSPSKGKGGLINIGQIVLLCQGQVNEVLGKVHPPWQVLRLHGMGHLQLLTGVMEILVHNQADGFNPRMFLLQELMVGSSAGLSMSASTAALTAAMFSSVLADFSLPEFESPGEDELFRLCTVK